MRIWRDLAAIPAAERGAAIAIGNMDGVHLGHRALIDRARAIASERGRPAAALTFEPHPRLLFQPDAAPFLLYGPEEKLALLAGTGLDAAYVQIFDRALSLLPAAEFVEEILVRKFGVSHVVVGEDFHFGHKRGGDVALLGELGAQHGFGVTALAPVPAPDGGVCSSSRIRALLAEGRPSEAAALLGRYWTLHGMVERGDQIGRRIGFPTANLRLGSVLHPARGIYAVEAQIDGHGPWHAGAANFGIRPTVADRGDLMEVHLLDFTGDLYGRRLGVRLVDYVRPEKKFDGLDALQAQIALDCRVVRERLAAAGPRGAAAAGT
ncbi:bifunctional riboflavin kinase/FAD synthetase [Oceanibaculum nanhaiense]|uniref:bifunctional riboflavin kinase/FAD synthetase n=1 Tax=Oceanibaculum nanhaiense TaxID=1909734 RepID=UPI000A3B964A|nr:bifunctional riboflavin kinase/FAD synthetase [Oceanibaculum nanhaiense]